MVWSYQHGIVFLLLREQREEPAVRHRITFSYACLAEHSLFHKINGSVNYITFIIAVNDIMALIHPLGTIAL